MLVFAHAAWVAFRLISGLASYLPQYDGDFTVFWTAPRIALAKVYDSHAITLAQVWATMNPTKPRPWVYPPTTLLLFKPLSLLPYGVAFGVWAAAGVSAYAYSAWRIAGRLWPLAFISPAVALTLWTGQLALLAGAGLTLAMIWLPRRPILAGLLIGLVAAMKPQVMVLAPLGLIVGGHWRALLVSVLAGAATGGLALLCYGVQPWFDWLHALRDFDATITGRQWVLGMSVTPRAFAAVAGVNDWRATALVLGAGLIALALVVATFSRSRDPVDRALALGLGFLLLAPYALFYELTIVTPAAIALLGRRSVARWLASFAIVSVSGAVLAVLFAALMVALPGKTRADPHAPEPEPSPAAGA